MKKFETTSPETLVAHGAYPGDASTGGIIPPLQFSSTYERDRSYALTVENQGYGRDKNPTYRHAENLLNELENGSEALTFSSGMAAAIAVFQALRPGDHVIAPKVMYWGLRNWLVEFSNDWGLELELADLSNPETLASLVRPGRTKLVWIETPCNPTWDIIDIARSAEIAHDAGAKLAVDSTVATPVLTRPLELGADIVFHSATKYLNGHSDVLAGALVTSADDEFWRRIRQNREHGGAVPGAFESWLLLRGMRTLYLRVRRACDNALTIARTLSAHENVEEILYPGLQSHPGHDVARRQMDNGFGGMLSIRVKGGADAALGTALNCNLIVRATSLGGTESLIEHRASIEGPDSPIPKDMLRLSVGIENPNDLLADLDQALSKR